MRKKIQSLIAFVTFLVLAVIGYFLIINKIYDYAILLFIISIICLIVSFLSLKDKYDSRDIYNKRVKDIIDMNSSVLVKIDNMPEFNNRKVVTIDNIDDLLDIQLDLKRPIEYLNKNDSCSFILLSDKNVFIYTIGYNEDLKTSIDIINEKKKVKEEVKEEQIESLDENINNSFLNNDDDIDIL